MYPDVSESVIPTEAKRSGGILCLPLSSYGKTTTRFLDLRRKASLARNDVHLSGYSISGFRLELCNAGIDSKQFEELTTCNPAGSDSPKL